MNNKIPIDFFETLQDTELGLDVTIKIMGEVDPILIVENNTEIEVASQMMLSTIIKSSIAIGINNFKIMQKVCINSNFGNVFNYVSDYGILTSLCGEINKNLR